MQALLWIAARTPAANRRTIVDTRIQGRALRGLDSGWGAPAPALPRPPVCQLTASCKHRLAESQTSHRNQPVHQNFATTNHGGKSDTLNALRSEESKMDPAYKWEQRRMRKIIINKDKLH